MDRNELRQMLSEAFEAAKEEKIDPAKIQDAANLRNDLGVDSLDVMEVVFEIEDRLNISIEEKDIKGVETVGQVLDMCERKLAEKKAS
ncbi:MAG TPA: phosphopantetheine-binding protein [Candidatus Brocadiia bacterium]|nr:phosphopantetheine-binding protein [Candidatus Brocadiia bacterium]